MIKLIVIMVILLSCSVESEDNQYVPTSDYVIVIEINATEYEQSIYKNNVLISFHPKTSKPNGVRLSDYTAKLHDLIKITYKVDHLETVTLKLSIDGNIMYSGNITGVTNFTIKDGVFRENN